MKSGKPHNYIVPLGNKLLEPGSITNYTERPACSVNSKTKSGSYTWREFNK